MTPGFTVAVPVTVGQRVFFPLIREEIVCCATGAIATRCPVALLFSDDEQWFFVPLEVGITQDVVRDLAQ